MTPRHMTMEEWFATNPHITMTLLWRLASNEGAPTTKGQSNPSAFVANHRESKDSLGCPDPDWINRYHQTTLRLATDGVEVDGKTVRAEGVITAQDWIVQHVEPGQRADAA